jgi:hypothetical protein
MIRPQTKKKTAIMKKRHHWQGKIGASDEKLRFICVTPRQKKYEIVVRCAKVELGLSK